MDDAIKDLDSNLGGQDAAASLANTQVLSENLSTAEKYFAKKPQTPLGAGYARDAQQHLDSIVKSIEARNFDAANDSMRGLTHSCKTCHEAYKPPE